MKKITLLLILMVTSLGFSQTQVTFKVDMTNYVGLGTGTVYVNGTFNGWAGTANPLVQEGTTNIWSGTFPIAPGAIEYKFTINGWDFQENLTPGIPCTITSSGYTNRTVTVGTSAMVIPTVCWQSCNSCSSTPTPTNVTFKVDMSNYVGLGTGTVYVNGTFNGWAGTANPLVQEGTTSIWSATFPIAQGQIEYKFTINGWAADEALTAGSSCTLTTNGFTNRVLVVGSTAIVNPVVCWASCASCTTNPVVAPSLPIDFESTSVTYAFTDFDGGTATKIVNPNSGGINTTATVAKMIKGAGAIWAGSYLTMAAPIDFSVNKTFKVKVFSPRIGAKLLLKVEGGAGVVPFEKEATCTVANAWEELTFDYSAVSTTNVYTKLVFIFDLGTVGDGSANFTFLVDEIRLIAPTTPVLSQMSLPVTFDSTTVDYGLISFGGTDSSVVVDPTLSTNKVAKVIKNAPETWAGTTITGLAQLGFNPVIPFTATERKMNVRVWSPAAGIPVRLKVEVYNQPTQSVETQTMTTVANGWQTLEFNFDNQAAATAAFNPAFAYNKATIFFNFGVAGTGQTYYFDDVKFGAAPVSLTQMSLPVSFDSTTVDYGVIGFGGAEDSSIVVDPTLASNKVAKVIKGAGAQTWAGTTITAAAQLGFSPAIPLTTTDLKMNVRVWSPNAGIQVRLKVENHLINTQTLETEATTTVANGWQTLEFNFANPASATAAFNPSFVYNKASIFFNFGVAGTGQTYYFDDVKFGAALGVNSFDASKVKMYPNPTNSQFTIEANNTIERVSLYNVLGQEVVSNQCNSNSVTVDISNLQTGVYVVKTIIAGVSSTSRIVKN